MYQVPLHKSNATLSSTLQVHPWIQPAKVQHASCSLSLHSKYFRGRQRITWLDANALFRWGLEPCMGIIVFYISISPILRDNEQSQSPKEQMASGCECMWVCVLVLPFQQHFDWQGTRVMQKLSFIRSQVTQKQRVTTALFLLSCFLRLPLHYSELGNTGCQATRWPHIQSAPNRAHLIFSSGWAGKVMTLCYIRWEVLSCF